MKNALVKTTLLGLGLSAAAACGQNGYVTVNSARSIEPATSPLVLAKDGIAEVDTVTWKVVSSILTGTFGPTCIKVANSNFSLYINPDAGQATTNQGVQVAQNDISCFLDAKVIERTLVSNATTPVTKREKYEFYSYNTATGAVGSSLTSIQIRDTWDTTKMRMAKLTGLDATNTGTYTAQTGASSINSALVNIRGDNTSATNGYTTDFGVELATGASADTLGTTSGLSATVTYSKNAATAAADVLAPNWGTAAAAGTVNIGVDPDGNILSTSVGAINIPNASTVRGEHYLITNAATVASFNLTDWATASDIEKFNKLHTIWNGLAIATPSRVRTVPVTGSAALGSSQGFFTSQFQVAITGTGANQVSSAPSLFPYDGSFARLFSYSGSWSANFNSVVVIFRGTKTAAGSVPGPVSYQAYQFTVSPPSG